MQAHIQANRTLVSERLSQVVEVLRERGPITAFDAVPHVYGERVTAAWWLTETLSYLTHLEHMGHVERHAGATDTWVSV